MITKSILKPLIFLIIALLSLSSGWHLIQKINPYFVAKPGVTRAQAKKIVENFFKDMGFDTRGFFVDGFFWYDQSGLAYLMSTFDASSIIAAGRSETIPLVGWRFFYYRNAPNDNEAEFYRAWLSPSGKLHGFEYNMPHSARVDTISQETALKLAREHLQKYSHLHFDNFILKNQNSISKFNRIDYIFSFWRTGPDLGDGNEEIVVTVSGPQITRIQFRFLDAPHFTTQFRNTQAMQLFFIAIAVILFLIFFIATIIIFLRKYHEGEIGARSCFYLAGLLLAGMVIIHLNLWNVFNPLMHYPDIGPFYLKLWQFFIEFLENAFIILLTAFAWATGENILRGRQPWLFSGIDSIFNGHWLTKNVGREVSPGFLFGLVLFGLAQIIIYLTIHLTGAVPFLNNNDIIFSSFLPVLSIILIALYLGLFNECVFRLFLISRLKITLKSTPAAIIVAALFFGIFSIVFNQSLPGFLHVYLTFIPYFVIGIFQGIIFWRFGFLTSLTSYIIFMMLNYTAPLLASTTPFFAGSGFFIIVLVTIIAVVGLVTRWRGKIFEYTPVTEPAHVRRIKERVRVQNELEVARKVQLGMLPRSNPRILGFDIAGACVPAYEVGGDYFDFIDLQGSRLGLTVADVSGKGVPAAIYMTLTKGILQSQAETEPSPKLVLSKVNRLIYRTMERNSFVSMFYAVLNLENQSLCFARAGHTPGIFIHNGKNEVQMLKTNGIGLGLEAGELFDKTLVEEKLHLAPGDLMVFYTDGFTEAMNHRLEQYGEDRLAAVIKRYQNSPAAVIVNKAFDDVRAFAHGYPQTDDMTIMVIKSILSSS